MTFPSGASTLEVEWKTPLFEVKVEVPPVVPDDPASSSENLLSNLFPINVQSFVVRVLQKFQT
jgi:hypothetical protein